MLLFHEVLAACALPLLLSRHFPLAAAGHGSFCLGGRPCCPPGPWIGRLFFWCVGLSPRWCGRDDAPIIIHQPPPSRRGHSYSLNGILCCCCSRPRASVLPLCLGRVPGLLPYPCTGTPQPLRPPVVGRTSQHHTRGWRRLLFQCDVPVCRVGCLCRPFPLV